MEQRCETCKFWNPSTRIGWQGEPYAYTGDCNKISDKVEAQLQTGWEGGYVKWYETDNDFGCMLWQDKQTQKQE